MPRTKQTQTNTHDDNKHDNKGRKMAKNTQTKHTGEHATPKNNEKRQGKARRQGEPMQNIRQMQNTLSAPFCDKKIKKGVNKKWGTHLTN